MGEINGLNGLEGVDRCLGKSAREVCCLGFRLRESAGDIGVVDDYVSTLAWIILPQIAQITQRKDISGNQRDLRGE